MKARSTGLLPSSAERSWRAKKSPLVMVKIFNGVTKLTLIAGAGSMPIQAVWGNANAIEVPLSTPIST